MAEILLSSYKGYCMLLQQKTPLSMFKKMKKNENQNLGRHKKEENGLVRLEKCVTLRTYFYQTIYGSKNILLLLLFFSKKPKL